jgi:hypothetical protein
VKDKTAVWQIQVPPNWTLLSTPGQVNSPDSTTTTVISGMSPYRPWRSDTLKMLNIDKVYENTAQRSLYRTKPSDGFASYQVEAPGNGKRCVAQIMLSLKYPEDEAKKIAMTLGPVH